MSVLVSELLNQTLKNPDINSPGDVLKFLNRKLPASLNKNDKERIADGLDMAICAFDPTRQLVYFAGANRPLWIIRQNDAAFECIEYKGTKASIGDNTPVDQEFETHSVPLKTGDRIFIFSDGVTDQFGGPLGKKLGKQAFKELLLESAHLSANEQHQHIETFFRKWMGPLDQLDDMLIVCIQAG
jgi:serine phosphatase RsbU (regulator of sigma subunit)